MKLESIVRLLENSTQQAIEALLNDSDTVFHVDWREEDDAIVAYCEEILQTGALTAEVIELEADPGCGMLIHYRDRTVEVPLVMGLEDRHITLCSLNEALQPDYEVRFCIDSQGSDTLTFLPLPTSTWQELEARFGQAVAQRFYPIKQRPNLFTEPFSTQATWRELAAEPSQKLAAIAAYRDEHGVGLAEAKRAVEAFLQGSR